MTSHIDGDSPLEDGPITTALKGLQDRLAEIDLLTRPSLPGTFQFMVKEYRNIKLKMDGDRKHGRPHLHIEYGGDHHAASYAIDDGSRLAGRLERKYDRDIRQWMATHRNQLQEAWTITQAGKKPDALIAELMGSNFP